MCRITSSSNDFIEHVAAAALTQSYQKYKRVLPARDKFPSESKGYSVSTSSTMAVSISYQVLPLIDIWIVGVPDVIFVREVNVGIPFIGYLVSISQ